jgi:hypothetical protein
MKHLRFFLIVVWGIFPVFIAPEASAQDTISVPQTLEERYEAFVKYLSPEKVYLHTDKDVYAIGDTIWFKCYVSNKSSLSAYPESKFVYVELVGTSVGKDISTNRGKEFTYVIQRVKVKMWNGILEGYIPVPDNVNTGYATLRAFTYWMLNKDAEYVFNKELSIINPIKDSFVEGLKEKKMRDDSNYDDIGVENPFHPIKRIQTIDCSFLPESGRLLLGTACQIGVKVINEQGLGQQAEGKVFDHNDVQVASFSADEYGFSSFILNPIDKNEKYYAIVEDVRENKPVKFRLPDVESIGASIALKAGKDALQASVNVSGIDSEELKFVLCSGDEIYYESPVSGAVKFNLPVDGMSPGINNAIVCSASGNIYAKRPFFVFPEKSLSPQIDYLDKDFGKRENVDVVLDFGKNVAGDFSVSVTDDFLAPANNLNNNILSYMFLSSEIRGNVENPQRFFSDSIDLEKRIGDLDLMLMTQGWEYYDLPAVLSGKFPMPKFGREYKQSISGQIQKDLLKQLWIFNRRKNKQKESLVAFLAPRINFAAVGKVNPEGYFELKDIDFPDSTTFIVKAATKYGGGGNLRPVIFEDSFAPLVKFVHNKEKVLYSPEVSKIITENYYNTGGELNYQLNSITVFGRKKSLTGISPLPNWEFRTDQIREGQKLAMYKNFDLISYIVLTCPGTRERFTANGRIVVTRATASASGMTVNDPWIPVVVFIDGIRINGDQWWEVEALMVDDVDMVVYLRGMEGAPFIASGGNGYGNNSFPSVVLIKTKPINRSLWHVSSGRPLGWQIPKHFYSPRYEVEGKDIVPKGQDKRSTLYWNPAIKPDENGKINFRFNASDLLGGYTVTVEGVASNGEYVSKRFSIK